MQTLREKYHEFEQQQEKTKKAQDQVKSSMNILINNLQSELESKKTKLTKVINIMFIRYFYFITLIILSKGY